MSLEYKKTYSCYDSKENTKQHKEENIVEATNHNLGLIVKEKYMCHTIIHEVTIVLDLHL